MKSTRYDGQDLKAKYTINNMNNTISIQDSLFSFFETANNSSGSIFYAKSQSYVASKNKFSSEKGPCNTDFQDGNPKTPVSPDKLTENGSVSHYLYDVSNNYSQNLSVGL